MSSVITYSTAERADVAGLLGAADRLTEDQQRALAQAREKAGPRSPTSTLGASTRACPSRTRWSIS
ncbi:hypothetical protein ABZ916_37030 [Streptomyces sp. NPDC046853]|uniref:hypothetical protein n=1 Tax=Streptomyces sp. NPDC046853 TaxID=3154920 RepID=UPI0033D2D474